LCTDVNAAFWGFLTSKVIFDTLRKAYENLYLLKIWGIV